MTAALAIDYLSVPVVHTAKAGGSYVHGKWVGETLTPKDIQAVVQPATGRRLLDLPEGERVEAKYFIWTREPIALDDEITYSGDDYRVSFLWPRPDGGFSRGSLALRK